MERRKRPLTHRCPNGATHYIEDIVPIWRKPGELKHLSTWRKRK
jgi:hypothetical protein